MRHLEKGYSLLEALLMIGLFLWLILMVNQTMASYWRVVKLAQKESVLRNELVNQREIERLGRVE